MSLTSHSVGLGLALIFFPMFSIQVALVLGFHFLPGGSAGAAPIDFRDLCSNDMSILSRHLYEITELLRSTQGNAPTTGISEWVSVLKGHAIVSRDKLQSVLAIINANPDVYYLRMRTYIHVSYGTIVNLLATINSYSNGTSNIFQLNDAALSTVTPTQAIVEWYNDLVRNIATNSCGIAHSCRDCIIDISKRIPIINGEINNLAGVFSIPPNTFLLRNELIYVDTGLEEVINIMTRCPDIYNQDMLQKAQDCKHILGQLIPLLTNFANAGLNFPDAAIMANIRDFLGSQD